MGCAFCATGQMGFDSQHDNGEILGQVLVARVIIWMMTEDWIGQFCAILFLWAWANHLQIWTMYSRLYRY